MNVKLNQTKNEVDNQDEKPEVQLNYRQRRRAARNLKNVAQGIRKHRDFSLDIQDGDKVILNYDKIMERINKAENDKDSPYKANKEYMAFIQNAQNREFTAIKSDVEMEHRNLFSLKEAVKPWLFLETDLIKVVTCE